MVRFEGYERRIDKINKCLAEYGFDSLEQVQQFNLDHGVDAGAIVRSIQPIAFENAVWAYTLGAAIALKKGAKDAAEAAEMIGLGLQAFCVPGSVADQRDVGIGHGNLAARLLREETKCFAFLAGHESFAAAEGAIGIARTANKVRKEPLQVILNGLGKDAAYIISRINGFTYVKTSFNQATGELTVEDTIAFSDSDKAKVRVYGAYDVNEGVAIMRLSLIHIYDYRASFSPRSSSRCSGGGALHLRFASPLRIQRRISRGMPNVAQVTSRKYRIDSSAFPTVSAITLTPSPR